MAASRITYQNKSNQQAIIDRTKQVVAEDMNEIKEVVNKLADLIDEGNIKGVANTTTDPGTPDGIAIWFLGEVGTYSNFGNIELSQNEIAFAIWNGSSWTKETIATISSTGEPNVQSDWNEDDQQADDYIKNKPTIPQKIIDLEDIPDYSGAGGKFLSVKSTEDGIEYKDAQTGSEGGSLTMKLDTLSAKSAILPVGYKFDHIVDKTLATHQGITFYQGYYYITSGIGQTECDSENQIYKYDSDFNFISKIDITPNLPVNGAHAGDLHAADNKLYVSMSEPTDNQAIGYILIYDTDLNFIEAKELNFGYFTTSITKYKDKFFIAAGNSDNAHRIAVYDESWNLVKWVNTQYNITCTYSDYEGLDVFRNMLFGLKHTDCTPFGFDVFTIDENFGLTPYIRFGIPDTYNTQGLHIFRDTGVFVIGLRNYFSNYNGSAIFGQFINNLRFVTFSDQATLQIIWNEHQIKKRVLDGNFNFSVYNLPDKAEGIIIIETQAENINVTINFYPQFQIDNNPSLNVYGGSSSPNVFTLENNNSVYFLKYIRLGGDVFVQKVLIGTSNSSPTINLVDGLQTMVELQEAAGETTVTDQVGGNNGTVNSGVTLGDTGFGNFAKSAKFNGSDSYIDFATFFNPSSGNEATISFWFKAVTESSTKFMAGYGWNGSGRYLFCAAYYGANPDIHTYVVTDAQYSAIKSPFNNDNNWHHLVIVKSAGALTYFLDGQQGVTTSTDSENITSNIAWMTIGRDKGDSTRDFVGNIVQYAVWNRALTSSEISELYNNGNGKLYSTF